MPVAGRKRPFQRHDGSLGALGRPADQTDFSSKHPRCSFIRPSSSAIPTPKLTPSIIRWNKKSSQPQISYYSQRQRQAATPTPATDPSMSLSDPRYGLPLRLVQNFARLGVNSIYPWQAKCLLADRLMEGEGNLVYSAPTGGGKSLVADILMLKKVCGDCPKKAILVLPYVALVQEKLRWLRCIVEGVAKSSADQYPSDWRQRGDENSIRVVGLFGGSKSTSNWADIDIAVCTIEKANSLVNTAIEDCIVDQLGIVVMDELHMLEDANRGYLLELMATKLLSLDQNIQLIGMSATLPNTELLARWLGGKYYISNYKPVPIEEHLVFDNAIYPASSSGIFVRTATQVRSLADTHDGTRERLPEPISTIDPSAHQELSNPTANAVVALAVHAACAGHGVLVFCSSRDRCEQDAKIITQAMPGPSTIDRCLLGRRKDVIGELRSTGSGLDSVLEKTIPSGVGFHHAGLTSEEREIIANAYDSGTIKILVATCTLAAGINLPARRVILHGARMGREFIGPSMLQQMRGRAGRKGKDEIGETYLCCQKSDLEAVAELMETQLPDISSALSVEKRNLERAMLEVIATKLATCESTIGDYIRKTLMYHTSAPESLASSTKEALRGLLSAGLVESNSNGLQASLLGRAIVASSMAPQDGIFIHGELAKSVQAFVLDGDMHVLHNFTPIHFAVAEIDWAVFQKEMNNLDDSGFRVMGFMGVKPTVVERMARGGTMKQNTPEEINIARTYRRFYSALQLRDLCNEMPVYAVARKYNTSRGQIQNLAQTCHGFAAGVIKLCERMSWGALAAALDHMSDRLKAGAKSDLLALAQITFVKSRTARVFWENGFKTVGAIAMADSRDLIPVLLQAQPRKPRLQPDDEQRLQQKLQMKAEIISKSASRIWERAMRAEIEEE